MPSCRRNWPPASTGRSSKPRIASASRSPPSCRCRCSIRTPSKLTSEDSRIWSPPRSGRSSRAKSSFAVWGSGYDTARAFVEIEHRGKLLQSFWTELGATQVAVKQQVGEAMRGGFTVRITMVRENRAYLHSQHVDVPWTNKNLTIKWEHFVSKLEPAQKETWTAVISGPDAKKAVAEMVAALYDASLDAYLPHNWASGFGVFRQDHSNLSSQFENQLKNLQDIYSSWRVDQQDGSLSYRHFPAEIVGNLFGYQFFARGRYAIRRSRWPRPLTGWPKAPSNWRWTRESLGISPDAKQAGDGSVRRVGESRVRRRTRART